MFPILFQKGPIVIYSYGVMLALAFLTFVFLARRQSARYGFSPDFIGDFSFYGLIAGLVGARLFYVIQEWQYFRHNLVEIVYLHQGGLVFYGGLMAAIMLAVVFVISKGYDWTKLADFSIPFFPLTHAIGRLGCYLNGCCYGVSYSGGQYPVQLYECAFNIVLAGLLFVLRSQRLKPQGVLLSLYLAMYAIGRWVLEFFRGDYVWVWNGLRISQWASVVCFVVACILWLVLLKRDGRQND